MFYQSKFKVLRVVFGHMVAKCPISKAQKINCLFGVFEKITNPVCRQAGAHPR